jgi:serine/threonine-protein kinase
MSDPTPLPSPNADHKAGSATDLETQLTGELRPPPSGSDGTGPPAESLPKTEEASPEFAARYSLTRLHATGGIGRVWLALDPELGREVALKDLRPERTDSSAAAARFLQEARVTGQLEHPGIVPVYELGRRPGDQQPFYTMRFVRGRTLTAAIRAYHAKRAEGRAGALDLHALLNTFVSVCNTLAYAHARGVIHRDLKPDNIILGDFGEVVVLDWGLAKLVRTADYGLRIETPARPDSSTLPDHPSVNPHSAIPNPQSDQTQDGEVLGTPAYMAPEQAAGRPDLIDRRTDVYGLGAILYRLLTDQLPFSGGTTQQVLRRVREASPPRPRQVCPGVPPALEAVCAPWPSGPTTVTRPPPSWPRRSSAGWPTSRCRPTPNR